MLPANRASVFAQHAGTRSNLYVRTACSLTVLNFNKIAPFGKEDTAKELQDHAAKTQDTLVDAVENAEAAPWGFHVLLLENSCIACLLLFEAKVCIFISCRLMSNHQHLYTEIP